jgi:hypothetical protein
MLAIKHELALVFENLVARPLEAHLRVFGRFFQVGLDRVNGVADENRLDDCQSRT